MTEKLVKVEKKGKIGYLILNRPEKLNALSEEMLFEFDQAMDEIEADDEISVMIIKGNGRAFSTGYDVGEYQDKTVIDDLNKIKSHGDRWIRVWEFEKPVIAQVHGYALAGGSQLCACCDVVITDEDAQLGFPSLPLGGGFVGIYWGWHIGSQRAKLLDLTAGSRISGKEAVEYGFAAKSFKGEDLEEETLNIARGMAKTPLDVLKLKKKAHNRIMELQGFRTGLSYGPDQDAIIHTAEGIQMIQRKINEVGLKGAIEWFNDQEV